MNLVLNYSDFDVRKIHFLDTKKNIIIDGIFTKMVYFDDNVSLNAIYIAFPYKCVIDKAPLSRSNIVFSTANARENQDIIQLETNILNAYMGYYQINKQMNTSLATQIVNGKTRLYKESENNDDICEILPILKISGVWETEYEIGITYKFVVGKPV